MPLVLDEKKYGRLLAKHLPSVIESDEEQDRLAEVLMRLTIPSRKLSPEESRMAALLGHLIDDYERRATEGKVKRFSPAERLAYLMEQHGLRQADLADLLGGQSVVSAVLAGKRRIHLEQAQRLAARFGVGSGYFIEA